MTIQTETLLRLPYAFNQAFKLTLADESIFTATQVVRSVPKKRLVAFGEWQNKPVVAKLFFHPKRAAHHLQKERRGASLLFDNSIPSPALYYEGNSQDQRIAVLLFERILHSHSLEEVWSKDHDHEKQWSLLERVILELATQHVLGILQEDLHFKNFLVTEKVIYTLDAADIKSYPPLLPKKISMRNVALFLSQLGVGVCDLQEHLFRYYANARGWILKQHDVEELFVTIKHYHAKRWQQYAKKIFRESSDFACLKEMRVSAVYDRSAAFPEFLAFIKDPDSVFARDDIHLLKAGRSSTVIRVKLDERDVVVKRYNMKNTWHRMRRAFRESRAVNSWRLAQKLKLFYVQTASPIAFIEYKWLGWRGASYYVTEYIPGEHLGHYLQGMEHDKQKIANMVKRMTELLKNVAALAITHGDLKMTNILVTVDDYPVLIDLDGAKEHTSSYAFTAAWKKEIKRFLANFAEQPPLYKLFWETFNRFRWEKW